MTTDTTAQADALLPCPFCGQSERLAEEWKDEDKHPLLLIGCDTRGCPGESREHYLLNGVRERAVAAWNRRALASSPAPLGGVDAYRPIDRDDEYDRDYIPMPGGWEIQTKGRGSSFRLAEPDDSRLAIPDSPYLRETLERMARDINAAWRRMTRSTPQERHEAQGAER